MRREHPPVIYQVDANFCISAEWGGFDVYTCAVTDGELEWRCLSKHDDLETAVEALIGEMVDFSRAKGLEDDPEGLAETLIATLPVYVSSQSEA